MLYISYCYFPFLFSLPPLSFYPTFPNPPYFHPPISLPLFSYAFTYLFIQDCVFLSSKLKSFSKKIFPPLNLFLFLITFLFISSYHFTNHTLILRLIISTSIPIFSFNSEPISCLFLYLYLSK